MTEVDYSKHLTGDIHQLNELLSNFTGSTEKAEDESLPSSLYVKNVDPEVFMKGNVTEEFEKLFRPFDANVTFQYFRTFKMVRVYFSNGHAAANARVQCHQRKVGDYNINCYFTQVTTNGNCKANRDHLQPPKPQRQFLISPPASPPLGWEPCEEANPILDFEILEALSKLTPGMAHELHPPTQNQPAIVVHICEEHPDKVVGEENVDQDDLAREFEQKTKIQQTRRPPNYMRSTSEGSDDSIDSM